MKKSVIFLFCLCFLFSSCSKDENKGAIMKKYSVSGCLSYVKAKVRDEPSDPYINPFGKVILSADGSSLILKHNDLAVNCATLKGDINLNARKDGNIIYIEEINSCDKAVKCMCLFNIYCEIGNMEEGNYTVYISTTNKFFGNTTNYAPFSFKFSPSLSETIELSSGGK